MKARSVVKEASSFTKFRLLMWKNFLQQWRHRVQTAVELLLPIGTMALVLILRSEIEPVSREGVTFPSIPVHTLNFSAPILLRLNLTRMSVAYSPQNEILEDLVRSSVVKLLGRNVIDLIRIIKERYPDLPIEIPPIDIPPIDLPPIDIPPDININITDIYEFLKTLVTVNGYNSSADLRGIYVEEAATREVIAAIQFEDELKDTTEIPNNLSYSLRFPERPRLNSIFSQGGRSWRTDILFPLFEVPGPRFPNSWEGGNDPGYVNELFIALQYAISTELITRITGENAWLFDVRIQRFPHPPYLEDLAVEALLFLFPMFILLSYSYTAVNMIRAVTVEKELQLKETMKIMGLPTWLHWTAWFCKQFLYLVFTSVFIVVLLKVNWFTNEQGFSYYAVFTNTPWTVLLFFLVLYLTCTIFFSFMVSGFFSKASTAALFGGVIWFLTYVPAVLLGMDLHITPAIQAFTCLSINTAMSFGFQLLLAKESTGGMQWGEFFTRNSVESSRFVFGHVVLMLVLDCIIYMLVALYLEQVFPGPFGAPKPWYFPFQRSFWCSTSKRDFSASVDADLSDVIKENDPVGHEVGVKMINLSKVYGPNIAVNRLNLNIYDDQITVLLGHNGAGKSTTISMLTGNVEITSGSVYVAGYDMAKQTREARAHIGLCPQHNVLFNEMTVREHLEFFARLKGYKGKELHEEIDSLIANLEMEEKRDYQSHGLSGGQKRRLCVGIALSGGARVVLLDEPTSGMDPASRRALWNLLEKQKKGRTMILTTHFMDEADFLGDRVAIMSSGSLQCVGSPFFLKRHYGVGYTLVVVKDEGFNDDALTNLIRFYIPDLTVCEDRGSEVMYNLLDEFSHKFEALLNDLEHNIEAIKFKNYGLISTSLEDVFMKVGSDVEIHSEADDATTVTTESCNEDILRDEFVESSLEQLDKKDGNATGIHLLRLHVLAIWLKLWLVWIRSWGLILLQFLVPILLMNTTLGVMEYMISNSPRVVSRPLTLAEGFVRTETLFHFNGTNNTSFGTRARDGYERFFNETNNANMLLTDTLDNPIDQYYLERTEDPIMLGLLRNRLLIGASLDDDAATAWFSNFGYHDVAISLATLQSALVKGKDAAANIFVFNHPLEATYHDQSDIQILLSMLAMQISSGIGSSMSIVSAVFIMFYVKERMSRAKLLQKASGVQPVVMWGAAWIFDWMWNNIISVTLVISCVAFQVIGLSTVEELGRMYLCLIVYGAAMLPLNYVLSHVFSGPALSFVVMFFVNLLLGMMGSQIVEALSSPFLDTKHVADVMDTVLQFFPLYSLITAIRSLIQVGLTRVTCMQACEFLLSGDNMTDCTMDFLCKNLSPSCCVRENPYLEWEEPGILRYLIITLASGVIFWLVLMFIEYRILQKIYVRTRLPPLLDARSLDEDVRAEAEHAEHAAGAAGQHALVAQRLTKYYGNNLAVDQLSFTVNDAECFGLLGVNGAGKTSTFKMLMADEAISSGNAFVSGYSVKTNVTKVYENIGYCPQFDAVFGELTGRETMRLFSLLRGARGPLAETRADALAYALGFTKHLDKRVDQYSGGNRRKLSTALALVGGARLVFVDEPTSGVDAAARRRVWRALMAARRANRALLLTSHSMEECEALCTRLTIMVNGRFQCLGTPQHLKNKFSEGFTLTIKMKMNNDDDDSSTAEARIETIKDYIATNFTYPKLMEEYQGLLTYYLPDRTMAWSKMFGVMERAKEHLDVEHYNISQTTLEQIFLQFTKYQKEQGGHETYM